MSKPLSNTERKNVRAYLKTCNPDPLYDDMFRALDDLDRLESALRRMGCTVSELAPAVWLWDDNEGWQASFPSQTRPNFAEALAIIEEEEHGQAVEY